MKKLTLGLFSILIAFSFGCNDDDDDMDMEPQFEVVWEETFEDGTGDWITKEDTGALGWCGNIYHRTVDNGNVMPSEGNGYAVAEHDSCNDYYSPFIPGSGPYRAYDDYSDEWPNGGFKGDLDIYLNPTWTGGAQGMIFTYVNSIDLLDLEFPDNYRYFAVNVTKQNNELYVAGEEVSDPGWYTFRFDYSRDDEDSLSVDFKLLQNGEEMFTEPIVTTFLSGENTSSFSADNVGTGYAWFGSIKQDLLLPIDEQKILMLEN